METENIIKPKPLQQIDFSAIDVNLEFVEFVHSHYSCILTSQVST